MKLDDPQDAASGVHQARGRIDKLVTVEIEARARLATQDSLAKPLAEKAGRPRVLVVIGGIRKPDLTRDQADNIVRVLLVVAQLVPRRDHIVGWRDHARQVNPLRVVPDSLKRPDRRHKWTRA